MEQFDTPILFVIFNRPDTTQKVFERIKEIKPKYLFIAADGPRENNPDDEERCIDTRKIVDFIDWNCEVKKLFRTNNLGCGIAVSAAITWFFGQVDEGIILEDDCLPDKSFFFYCRDLLKKYRNDSRIYFIGGANFQNGIKRGTGSYYFSKYNHIWGWATWKRVWEKYDYKMITLSETLNNNRLDHIFNNKSEKKYWTKVFRATKNGQINTWDYQLTFAIWDHQGICVIPNENLIVNIGSENNSTRKFLKDSFRFKQVPDSISFPLIHPEFKLQVDADRFTFENIYGLTIRKFFRHLNENGLILVIKYLMDKRRLNK